MSNLSNQPIVNPSYAALAICLILEGTLAITIASASFRVKVVFFGSHALLIKQGSTYCKNESAPAMVIWIVSLVSPAYIISYRVK